jgi:stearoyl-CoA desaturase (delta-9 desaturase)
MRVENMCSVPLTIRYARARYEKAEDMTTAYTRSPDERINWVRSIPFIVVHLIPLLAIWTGATLMDWAICVGLYVVRMFFITGVYHRYFSHRAYKMGRVMQFLMAFGGGTAGQKGALWWAAHHRHHHKYSDMQEDVHSPLKGFLWSHVGWILCNKYNETDYRRSRISRSTPSSFG